MEELFDQAGPDLDKKEAHKAKAFIRRIMQYDRVKRPLPTEILSDPWLCEIEAEIGSFN